MKLCLMNPSCMCVCVSIFEIDAYKKTIGHRLDSGFGESLVNIANTLLPSIYSEQVGQLLSILIKALSSATMPDQMQIET